MGLPRKLVANHLHVHLLTHLEPKVSNEVFINPRLQFAHPALGLAFVRETEPPSMDYKAEGPLDRLTKGLSSRRSGDPNLEQPDHLAGLERVFEIDRQAGHSWFHPVGLAR